MFFYDSYGMLQDIYLKFCIDTQDKHTFAPKLQLEFVKVFNGSNKIILKLNDPKLFVFKEWYFFGQCLSLMIAPHLSEQGIKTMKFEFSQEMLVLLSYKNQFTKEDTNSYIGVTLGKFTGQRVGHEINKQLKNCVPDYDFDDCIYQRLYEISMEKVGCTVPWMKNKSNICTIKSKCHKAIKIYDLHKYNRKNICPKPCSFTNLYFSPTYQDDNWKGDSVASLTLYFDGDIRIFEEYFLHNYLSLYGNIGGLVGLILGVSIINIRDLLNSLLIYFE